MDFNNKARPRSKADKEKNDTCDSAYTLYEGRQLTFNDFKSGIFPLKSKQGKGCPSDLAHVAKVFNRTQIKILAPKQMLQRLVVAVAQVQTGNTSENLLNEIRQIVYSLHEAKEIIKKVYNSIMNSIKV